MTGYKRVCILCCMLLVLLAFTGCAGQNDSGNNKTAAALNSGQQDAGGENEAPDENTDHTSDETDKTKEEAADTAEEGIYILMYANTDTSHFFLQEVNTRRQEEFEYNGGTYIRDRYGSSITVNQLQTGELLKIKTSDDKVLREVQIAKETYIYDEITNFSIDSTEKILTVGGSNYYYDDALKVFSDNGIIPLNEVSDQDTICIRGEGKKIHTIVVTRGHGTILLKNTDIFEGGMVAVGNVIATQITHDMQLEVPEGTYTISVANEGYGGNREITVKRYEELAVNLDDLKGEGPKSGKVKLNVTPEDAEVTINGAKADCSQVLDLAYGTYAITVKKEGYQSFSGNLVVSSAESAIPIELMAGSNTAGSSDNTSSDKSNTNQASGESSSSGDRKAGSLAGSRAGSKTSGGSASSGSSSTSSGSGSSAGGDSSTLSKALSEILNSSSGSNNTLSDALTDMLEDYVDQNKDKNKDKNKD